MKIEFCTRWGLSFNSIMNSNHVTSKIRHPLFAHSSCLSLIHSKMKYLEVLGAFSFSQEGKVNFIVIRGKYPEFPPPPPSHPSPVINNDRSLLLIISDLHTATFLPAAIICSSEQASTVTPSLVTVFLCQVAQVFSDEAI